MDFIHTAGLKLEAGMIKRKQPIKPCDLPITDQHSHSYLTALFCYTSENIQT